MAEILNNNFEFFAVRHDKHEAIILGAIANDLGEFFAKDNPNFDWGKWEEALVVSLQGKKE